jgi:hypothetical protein
MELNTLIKTLSTTDTILTALNNKSKAKELFRDVEKALDCVSHNILSCKLEIYGITGVAKNLYSQHLKDRYQRVTLRDNLTLHNIVSNWSQIQQGVPQGSALDPLLFLLYINDLTQATADSALPILFVDDTSLLATDKSPDILDTKFSVNLEIVDKWFKSNLLPIHFFKTFSMQFITKNSVPTNT